MNWDLCTIAAKAVFGWGDRLINARYSIPFGFVLMCTMSFAAAAPRFEFGFDAGKSAPSESGFENSDGAFASIGVRFAKLDSQLTIGSLGKFNFDGDTSNNIRVDALSLVAGPHYKPGEYVGVDLFGGVTAYRSVARIAGVDVGENRDWTATLGAGVSWAVKHYFELRMRGLYYHDVSGTQISAVTFGVNFLPGKRPR